MQLPLRPNMKNFFCGISFFCLSILAGCGSGPGINGIPAGSSGTGNYSTSSLNGSYVYQLDGTNDSNGASYHEAGVFTADGSGHITSGIDDFTEGGSTSLGNTVTGTYTVANDGTGSIILNGTGFSLTLAATLVSSSKVDLVEEDALNASGAAELQNAAAITSGPTGTYVFRMHTTSNQGSTATVGQFTVSAGIFQSGSADVNHAGLASSPTLNNFNFNAPVANGRGTGSFTESSGTVSDFNYYIVDANNIRFLFTDAATGGSGRAEMQTGGPFSTASFAGTYVFIAIGDDNEGIDAVNTIGEFSASSGTFSGGTYDSVRDGNVLSNVVLTGTSYQVGSNGRVTATLVSSSGTETQTYWMVSPSRAFFVTASDTGDPSKVEDGEANLQSGSFSNSALSGQYAFGMHGFTPNFFVDRTATLQADGAGNLKLNEFVNDTGTGSTTGVLIGTYSVGANGRATGTITNLSPSSNDLIFYLYSPTDGFVLQEDSGTELVGSISLQH